MKPFRQIHPIASIIIALVITTPLLLGFVYSINKIIDVLNQKRIDNLTTTLTEGDDSSKFIDKLSKTYEPLLQLNNSQNERLKKIIEQQKNESLCHVPYLWSILVWGGAVSATRIINRCTDKIIDFTMNCLGRIINYVRNLVK